MATAQKNINDYYTIKKRITNDDCVNKFSKSDCFKVPYPPNNTTKNQTVIKSVVTPKKSTKTKKCDSIDIRDALKKATSLNKLNNSDQEEARTPKRKEISPIFGDALSLSDSKKKKIFDDQEDDQKSFAPSDTQIEPNTTQLKSKIRKKIFQDDNSLKNDLPNHKEEKVKQIIEELNCSFVPLSPLAPSPTKTQSVASSAEASQKLSLEQVKSRLVNCSKLSELKKRLVSINDCASKLIEFQKKTSSPVKINLGGPESPTKSSRPIVPCNLLSPKKILEANDENFRSSSTFEKRESVVSSDPGLPLPVKFQALSELFNSLDIIVAMLFNRKESCSFDKVKASVQKMLRKNFDVKKLGIIATIYPDAYTYTIQKWCKKERTQSDYQLVLMPKIDCDRMLPTHLSERKEKFYNKLLDIVKDYHKQFLSNLDPPIIIENNSLRRWHPRFKLHDIADIKVNSTILPKPPEKEEQISKSSVENFLLYSQEKLGLDAPNHQENHSSKPSIDKKINDKITCGLLKGVSKNLLEKVSAFTCLANLLIAPQIDSTLRYLDKS